MEDIPQPASEPYSVGERVQVYLSSSDADSRYHGLTAKVVAKQTDDLGEETGRAIDAYSYTLEDTETGEQLPVVFRHRDLVPVENDY